MPTIKKTGNYKRKLIVFFSHYKVLSKVYSLDVSTEGHRQYLYTTPALSVNPLPEIQSCFPWPAVDRNESEPRGRSTERTSYEQKHGLMSLIYCLT